jgi:metal-responsive CopG/Arc/MetJ family transcriptional regulator
MPRINVELDTKLHSALKKRADENFLSLSEMVKDIVRRSMVSYTGGHKRKSFKIEDKLVGAFSRERKGPKRGSKKKKKK